MNESSKSFLIQKTSSMTFKELGEYIEEAFECLGNPQKQLAVAKKVSSSKETYDLLIECLELKLSRIENLIYCKESFETFNTFDIPEIEISYFNTLVEYHQASKTDKRIIEDEIQSKRQDINQLLLLLLKNLLSENKTASIFLNSSESFDKILNLLLQLSESNSEVKEIIALYRIQYFRKILSEKFQFSNSDYYGERLDEWINNPSSIIGSSGINLGVSLQNDFRSFIAHYRKDLRLNAENDYFIKLQSYWYGLIQDLNYGIKRFTDLENSENLPLKKRLQRIFRFRFFDKILRQEINILTGIISTPNFAQQVNKLLKLETSISKFLIEKNNNLKFVNELFTEYESERIHFISNINENAKNLIESIIPKINSEIERLIQLADIDSDLVISRKLIDNLKESKNRIFIGANHKMIMEEIFWDLLPQGEWKTEGLIKTFKGYGWSKDEFDENRLMQIIKILKPTICHVGKEKFQGYVVFGFNSTGKVVLECPKYGNAIYIIKENWQEITKLSKWEARQLSQVTVIRHSDTWFERLKENLTSKY